MCVIYGIVWLLRVWPLLTILKTVIKWSDLNQSLGFIYSCLNTYIFIAQLQYVYNTLIKPLFLHHTIIKSFKPLINQHCIIYGTIMQSFKHRYFIMRYPHLGPVILCCTG